MKAGDWKSVTAVKRYAHPERKTVDEAVRSVATPLAQKDLTVSQAGTVKSPPSQAAHQKTEKDV